jgi:hypothetical protein
MWPFAEPAPARAAGAAEFGERISEQSVRFSCTCAVVLVLVAGVGAAGAQESSSDAPAGPETQVWLNVTPGWSLGKHWYWELDAEPKWQVSGGEQWRNLDLTPAVEYYPLDWLDLSAEATVGRTHQRDGLDTFEVTERLGVRLHLFGKIVSRRRYLPGLGREHLPLTRVHVSTLVRLEQRNFFYSDATPDSHGWRARLRLEGKLALNHSRLAQERTLYALGDVEYYQPIGEEVEERYVNRMRVRLGLGYRPSARTRIEAIYIRDWNRDSPEAYYAGQDTQAVDLRWKLFF